jgi:hypothetical protein
MAFRGNRQTAAVVEVASKAVSSTCTPHLDREGRKFPPRLRQPARYGQAKRNRSRKLSAERVVPHCGSSDQAHRGVAPLERRRKSTAPQPRGSLEEGIATDVPTNRLPDLPYIEETIEHGGISIGFLPPLRECIAVAHEGRHTLAMLKTSER